MILFGNGTDRAFDVIIDPAQSYVSRSGSYQVRKKYSLINFTWYELHIDKLLFYCRVYLDQWWGSPLKELLSDLMNLSFWRNSIDYQKYIQKKRNIQLIHMFFFLGSSVMPMVGSFKLTRIQAIQHISTFFRLGKCNPCNYLVTWKLGVWNFVMFRLVRRSWVILINWPVHWSMLRIRIWSGTKNKNWIQIRLCINRLQYRRRRSTV